MPSANVNLSKNKNKNKNKKTSAAAEAAAQAETKVRHDHTLYTPRNTAAACYLQNSLSLFFSHTHTHAHIHTHKTRVGAQTHAYRRVLKALKTIIRRLYDIANVLSALGVVDKVVCNAPLPGEAVPKAGGSRKPYFRWTTGRPNVDLGIGVGDLCANRDDGSKRKGEEEKESPAVVTSESVAPPAKKPRQNSSRSRPDSLDRSPRDRRDSIPLSSMSKTTQGSRRLSVDTSVGMEESSTRTPLPGKKSSRVGGGGKGAENAGVAAVGTAQAVLRFQPKQGEQQQHSALRLARLQQGEGACSQGHSTGVGTPVQLESVRTKMAFDGGDTRRMTL